VAFECLSFYHNEFPAPTLLLSTSTARQMSFASLPESRNVSKHSIPLSIQIRNINKYQVIHPSKFRLSLRFFLPVLVPVCRESFLLSHSQSAGSNVSAHSLLTSIALGKCPYFYGISYKTQLDCIFISKFLSESKLS
jgi:hypothetical protein